MGMDKDACKYMDPPCGEAVGSNGVRSYRFPIDCLQVYPAVSGGGGCHDIVAQTVFKRKS